MENLADCARHAIDKLRGQSLRNPDPRLDELLEELERYVPPAASGPDHLGFAVPLRLRCSEGELRLITALTMFATAVDITLAELQPEAFLPADEATAQILRRRARRPRNERHRSLPPELVASGSESTRSPGAW